MEVFSTLDGVVLSGGGDVDSFRYGGVPASDCGWVDRFSG